MKTFTAGAKDNMNVLGYSPSVILDVADPSAPPYRVKDLTQNCDQNTYLMPISVMPTYNLNNVIGYDMVLNYDAAKLTPSGEVFMNTNSATNTINPTLVDVSYAILPVNGSGTANGTMNISISLVPTAPANTFFTATGGTGKDICFVKFTRNGLANLDSTNIVMPTLNESYYNNVFSKNVASGKAKSIKNTTYVGNLNYWFDNQAMSYPNLIQNLKNVYLLFLERNLD
jgi:hypothetical protein